MMMDTVSVKDAEAHFAELLERVAKGETVVIADEGTAVATLAPVAKREIKTKRRIGFMEGEFTVPDDFDRMFADEIADIFDGK